MTTSPSILSVEYLPRIKTLNVVVQGIHGIEELGPPRMIQPVKLMNTRLTWRNHEFQATAEKSPSLPKSGECSISCTKCNANIIKRTELIFKMLPSESWIELMECWSCHRDEFAGVDPLFRADRGIILVDVDHVLVNRADVTACSCISIDEAALNVRLNKEAIKFEISDGTIVSYSLESVLVQLLKAMFEGHSTWKFCLSTPSTNEHLLYLWMLSWDIYHSEQDIYCLKSAIKVGFSLQSERITDSECILHRCEEADRLAAIIALLQAKSSYETTTSDEGIEYAICYLKQ